MRHLYPEQHDTGTRLATPTRRRPSSECNKGNRRRLHAGYGDRNISAQKILDHFCPLWLSTNLAQFFLSLKAPHGATSLQNCILKRPEHVQNHESLTDLQQPKPSMLWPPCLSLPASHPSP